MSSRAAASNRPVRHRPVPFRCAVLVAAALSTPASAAAPPGEPVPFAVERIAIAPGVYGSFEKRLDAVVSGNIIAVIGATGVLLYDSGHHPAVTRRVLGDFRRLTRAPVRYVVNSHWHDDHWLGNAAVAESFPDVEIVAHPATAAMIAARRDSIAGDPCRHDNLGDAPRLRERLAAGTRSDGTPITPAVRATVLRYLAVMDSAAAECDGITFRGVDRTVADTRWIDLGGKAVELRFLGRANTGGDLVAWLPESRTLLTGDIVVWPFPFATHVYPTEWVASSIASWPWALGGTSPGTGR